MSTQKRTTPKVVKRAKELRRNQTDAEAKLWSHLRKHPINDVGFRRQNAIDNYVVDFCAPRRKLIIELDGSQPICREIATRCALAMTDAAHGIIFPSTQLAIGG